MLFVYVCVCLHTYSIYKFKTTTINTAPIQTNFKQQQQKYVWYFYIVSRFWGGYEIPVILYFVINELRRENSWRNINLQVALVIYATEFIFKHFFHFHDIEHPQYALLGIIGMFILIVSYNRNKNKYGSFSTAVIFIMYSTQKVKFDILVNWNLKVELTFNNTCEIKFEYSIWTL